MSSESTTSIARMRPAAVSEADSSTQSRTKKDVQQSRASAAAQLASRPAKVVRDTAAARHPRATEGDRKIGRSVMELEALGSWVQAR